MPGRIPGATYRLQFNRDFPLTDACHLVPYLHSLGITDLYASPVLQTRTGSSHGYDVTDPGRLNVELGGEEGLAALTRALQEKGMGLLLDIVPNHVAASSENPWWLDVLQNGPVSPYASYFDIDWQAGRSSLPGKVLVPVLGAPYGKVLENQELHLELDRDGFWISYYTTRLPLRPDSYRTILEYRAPGETGTLEHGTPAWRQLQEVSAMLAHLPPRSAGEAFAAAWTAVEEKLWHLYNSNFRVQSFLDARLQLFNGKKGEPESFTPLDRLLARQHWRLAWWRVAGKEINYRRFFDINDLVGLRVEEEQVYAATHARVLQLARTGQVTGFRVDHIDGLYDPAAYLRRLQESLTGAGQGPDFYVLVEKILGDKEELPGDWLVNGTTGYDFLNMVNGLNVDSGGSDALDALYGRVSGDSNDFTTVVYKQKCRVMNELLAGELDNLVRGLARLAAKDRHGRDFTFQELREALAAITACLPVYRTYIRGLSVAPRDRQYIEYACHAAAGLDPGTSIAGNFLRRVLLLEFPTYLSPEQRQEWLDFVRRWQQFTGPVMAKGFEDTALYVFTRLLSLNEVGGNPQRTGVSIAEWHRRLQERQARWPFTLNTTSTHDTKRSEDVRARVNVLSELPEVWTAYLERWRSWNQSCKPLAGGRPVPDGSMELLIYQTLLGAWPLQEADGPDFKKRLEKYLVKAAREAKTFTNWLNPDIEYEQALLDFLAAILEPGDHNLFLPDFLSFQKSIARYGALNSLVQVLFKITSPGVPDFYQGTELWDFSLVDPDNRRPVDFPERVAILADLQEQEVNGLLPLVRQLLASWEDGRIKMYVTHKALHLRRQYRELFITGEYLPLRAVGKTPENVCAFCRHCGDAWVLVAAPRLVTQLQRSDYSNPGAVLLPPPACWGDTALVLPPPAPRHWQNIFTGKIIITAPPPPGSNDGGLIPLAAAFRHFPVALLTGKQSS